MISYGDTEYQWTHGKQLEYIIDGENEYHYQYDSNGIRAHKTVNGAVTEFDVLGTKILAQHGAGGNMYFQYCNDSLIGFVYGTTQYYYVTNLNGDIVGITDADGNLIAEYEYDEWGKLLNITTAEEGNAEQLKVAEANPFRYRGYYYDNETGMYYLNSRYYNPELGRFISADDFSYLDSGRLTRNAYCYCVNNPLKYYDPNGYDLTWSVVFDIIAEILIFDQISIDMSELFGENFTAKFFDFLGELFSLVPSMAKLTLEIVQDINKEFLDILAGTVKESLHISGLVLNRVMAYCNSITESLVKLGGISFSKAFGSWIIGFLPAQIAILLPGILLDEDLSSTQKFVLIIIDTVSVIISQALTIASTLFKWTGIGGVIATGVSIGLPIITDLIAQLIMKRK